MPLTTINQPISVTLKYDSTTNKSIPTNIVWRGKDYEITKLGYHHAIKEGRTLIHIFTVENNTASFRLSFNSETLGWKLEEIFTE